MRPPPRCRRDRARYGGAVSALSRLMVALCTSGLLLGFLGGARFGHPWWAIALAPAPALVALRCLPLPAGMAAALAIAVGGRVLGALTLPLEGGLGAAALDGLSLMPALLVDRWLVTRWPRAGAVGFPVAVVATGAAAYGAGAAITPLPAAAAGAFGVWATHVGWAVPMLVCASVAQAIAGLASVDNWHRPDPRTQAEREAGVRQAAIAAAVVLVLALAGAPLLLPR